MMKLAAKWTLARKAGPVASLLRLHDASLRKPIEGTSGMPTDQAKLSGAIEVFGLFYL